MFTELIEWERKRLKYWCYWDDIMNWDLESLYKKCFSQLELRKFLNLNLNVILIPWLRSLQLELLLGVMCTAGVSRQIFKDAVKVP